MDEQQQRDDDGQPTLEGCFAPDGTDLTLIEWFLRRTPGERLQTAQSMVDLVAAARHIDEAEPLPVLRALHDHAVEFVVVGALAAILEDAPINTFDVAVVYQGEPTNLERLLAALTELDATYRDATGRFIRPDLERLATNRINLLQTPVGVLDAMTEIAPGWRFEDLVERSRRMEIWGMNLRVLNLASLIESKGAVGRPMDHAVMLVLRNSLEMRRNQGSYL